MPDKRISELTEITAPTHTDVLPIVNAATTKKVTIANLVGSFVAIDDTDSPYALGDSIAIILGDTSAGNITVNLPAAADSVGRRIWIKNLGVGTVTVDGNGAETIDDDLTQILAQYSTLQIISDGSEWWIL